MNIQKSKIAKFLDVPMMNLDWIELTNIFYFVLYFFKKIILFENFYPKTYPISF